MTTQRIDIEAAGRRLDIEYAWAGSAPADAPVIVFLHEGLGSISMWRNFPKRLSDRLGFRGLVYSRFGYGHSTPRPHDEPFPKNYLHREAIDVLPALLDALSIDRPWLFGHSDGGTIALLAAAHIPARVKGIVIAAPHIFVEPGTVIGVKGIHAAYLQGPLREQLARYHDDVGSAFYGWYDTWTDPAFADWNIEADLDKIQCPVLAIQGEDDEYASLEQIRGIQRRIPATHLLILPHCGHSPHRDQPEAVVDHTAAFIRGR